MRDDFLAGGAGLVQFEVVADAVVVEQVAAGEVGAHGAGIQFLVAGEAAALEEGYIYCSPPSNSIVTRASMALCGSPLRFCTFSIQLCISCSSSSSFSG